MIMVRFTTDEEIRKADFIEAVDADGTRIRQLWGTGVVAHLSAPGSPPHRIEVVDYPVLNRTSELLKALLRINEIRGGLPLDSESLVKALQGSPQFRITVLRERRDETNPLGTIEFNGLSIEELDGTITTDERPYSAECSAVGNFDRSKLEALAPIIAHQLRIRCVLGSCGDYYWTTN